MSKIIELRNKRNTLWEQTKAFLEDHRDDNGLVEASAVETYNKMAEEYKMEVDKIKQYVDEKIIVLDMKRRKAAQLIRDTAVDKEPEAKEEAAE